MNFKEAMEVAKQGKRVYRKNWGNNYFLEYENDTMVSYRHTAISFSLTKEIIDSVGWEVEGLPITETPLSFMDTIDFIKAGRRARFCEWKPEIWIQSEHSGSSLFQTIIEGHRDGNFQYHDLIATDWEISN